MTNQVVKIHQASQLSAVVIDSGIIIGILLCLIGFLMVLYSVKFYR